MGTSFLVRLYFLFLWHVPRTIAVATFALPREGIRQESEESIVSLPVAVSAAQPADLLHRDDTRSMAGDTSESSSGFGER